MAHCDPPHADHAALTDPHRHGDADAATGIVDFAVNVQPGPPEFIRRILCESIDDLAAYPSERDHDAVRQAAARAHGCRPDQVLPLAGAAEGFELLRELRSTHAALIQPSFTEPERLLRATDTRISQVILPPPWTLDPALVPPDADLVLLGNPTNPTSVLHSREMIDRLTQPGRVVVVDEAFADLTCNPATGATEPESLIRSAAIARGELIVIRSVTKTFGLAGLRAGYLIAAPSIIATLTRGRRHWPIATPTLRVLAECLGDVGQRYTRGLARSIAADRSVLVDRLADLGLVPAAPPAAPFVLLRVPGGLAVKAELRNRGFGVRSCANFIGLGPDHLRLAVRAPDRSAALVAALAGMMS